MKDSERHLRVEATTVIKLAMQKGKRVKIFEKLKTETQAAEKTAIGSLNTKIYSIIDEYFSTIQQHDGQFKQNMIDKSKLMESSITLINIDFEAKKAEFTKSEETLFQELEEKIKQQEAKPKEETGASAKETTATDNNTSHDKRDELVDLFPEDTIESLTKKLTDLKFPNQKFEQDFDTLQQGLIQTLVPEVQGMTMIPADVTEADITKFRIHAKRLVSEQIDKLKDLAQQVKVSNNHLMEQMADMTESIEVKITKVSDESQKKAALDSLDIGRKSLKASLQMENNLQMKLTLAYQILLMISRFVTQYSKTRTLVIEAVEGCVDSYSKFFERVDKKVNFLMDKCSNKKLQDNIRGKINKEEWDHAIEAIDKQRENLDASYAELDTWLTTIYKDTEQCVDKCRRRLIRILEEEFTEVDDVAKKITTKFVKMSQKKTTQLLDYL